MNKDEEALQRAVERGLESQPDSLDEKAYREVFRALRKDPGYSLDGGFAERVATSAIVGRRSQDSADYVWFAVGITVLLVAFAGALVYTGFSLDLTWLTGESGIAALMSDYKGLVVFGFALITLLNWIDKRLVRRQAHH